MRFLRLGITQNQILYKELKKNAPERRVVVDAEAYIQLINLMSWNLPLSIRNNTLDKVDTQVRVLHPMEPIR